MAYGRRARFEELRQLAFGSIGAGYVAVGAATQHYTRIASIFNSTDVDIHFSLDGATTQIRLAPSSGQIFDFTANEVRDDGLFIPEGTIFWAKEVAGAPTKGAVWVEICYADGGV